LDENTKYLYEQNKRDAERAHDVNTEFFYRVNDATIATGTLAVRMSLLVNGGAAIAILAFIKDLSAANKAVVANGLAWFAWGAATAVAGIGLAYFTNYYTAEFISRKQLSSQAPFVRDTPASEKAARLKTIFHFFALAVSIASLSLFVRGMFAVKTAILHLI
jgi:hypothetical protein